MANALPKLIASSAAIMGRAASYARMSTEKQDYSISHQKMKIEEFAARNSMRIVREYADEGRSGLLGTTGRPGLSSLMDDVQSGATDYSVVIVYDVSRWGRFQDVDEAAFYEHTCRLAGIQVLYCAEQFNNDGSALASLIKGIKRMMAAEYSRELSAKVFLAQCRFARMGFRQGGQIGYGLRRISVSAEGVPRRILLPGEQKSAATDRVVIALGPERELATVRRIYSLYIHGHMGDEEIARLINSEHIQGEPRAPWTKHKVVTLLTNVKYAGVSAFNRKSCKLSTRCKHNPVEEWIVHPNAFECVVSPDVFRAALEERRRRRAQALVMVQMLVRYFQAHGRINERLIDADPSMPHSSTFIRRFGSLAEAYRLAGIAKNSDCSFVIARNSVQLARQETFARACELMQAKDVSLEPNGTEFVIRANGKWRIRVDAAACRLRSAPFWMIRRCDGADFVLVARMEAGNASVRDYLVIPSAALFVGHIYLRQSKPFPDGCLRFSSIEEAFGFAPPAIGSAPAVQIRPLAENGASDGPH